MEKALYIIIFMYAASYSVAGVQYVIGDYYDIQITNYDGAEIQSPLEVIIDLTTFNTVSDEIVNGTFTGNTTYYDKVETFTTAAAAIAWNLVLLLSGTYIFNFLYLLGVPAYFVAIFVVLYLLLLARAIIGYIRGI